MIDWTSLTDALNGIVTDTFGREVLYVPKAGDSRTVKIIFETIPQQEQNSPGIFALVFLRLADLATPPERGDQISIDSVAYKVFEIEADEVGGVRLGLHK